MKTPPQRRADLCTDIPPPVSPVATHQSIKITLGRKQYEMHIAVRAHEVKPEPAEVIPMPPRRPAIAANNGNDLGA